MDVFSEAERQVLIALIELERPKTTPNNNFYKFFPKTLEAARTYFRGCLESWDAAYRLLKNKGLIQNDEGRWSLTGNGLAVAEGVRKKYPPIYYWYREFYAAARTSRAYAGFCEAVYGRNFSQHGFSDMRQIGALLAVTGISRGDRVLDLGCGNGGIAEYVSDSTGARVTGVDYIPEAIARARTRTAGKGDRLFFEEGFIGGAEFAPASFDVVMSIDSIFFGEDMVRTLEGLGRSLAPTGQMAIFYSEFRFDPGEPVEKLRASGTVLARALEACGLRYRAYDFRKEHFAFMKLKHAMAQKYKEEFEAEGNDFLYRNVSSESADEAVTEEDFARFSSRYLYHVRLTRGR